MLHFAKVLVIPRVLTGEQGVEGVVEIVTPLGVKSKPSEIPGTDQSSVIEVAFRYEVNSAAEPSSAFLNSQSQLLQEWLCGEIQDPVDGVYSECVNVELS
jgi:hypothetical protein